MSTSAAGEERLRLRLRLSRLLNTADWRPSGMPPTAVLIVRHLADPLPGQLGAQATAVRPPAAWETAVRQQMTTLYRHAARPSRGQLPPSASTAAAILFGDEAEMLACLALDAVRGLAGDRWWWQALRRARPGLRWQEPVPLLREQPRLIPAIFTHLHSWGLVEVITAVLSTAQATDLLTAVNHTFHLPPLPHPTIAAPPTRSGLILTPIPSPPWESLLPTTAVPTTLPPAHACLVGLSLSLNRRPAAVTTPHFSRQLQSWWQAQTQPQTYPPADSLPLDTAPTPTRPATNLPLPFEPEASASEKSPSAATLPDRHPTGPPAAETEAIVHQPKRPSPPTNDEPPPTAKPTAVATPTLPAPDPTETAVFPDDGISTQLGGILYLVNMMVRLDIPACYEEMWHLASQVGAWGALELLALGLLAPLPPHLENDPIWTALAELDGRASNHLPITDHRSPNTESHPWLAHALPGFRAHLLTTLQLDDPNLLGGTLLLVNGRLHITPTHVDLIMRLEDVSLPVRLAGLDFDPGWQPAFGRVIQFHFQ